MILQRLPGLFLGAQSSSLHSIQHWVLEALTCCVMHPRVHQVPPDHPLGVTPSASRLSCSLHSHPEASPEQLEIMSQILLQEIKLRKEPIFTVNIDYRKDWENVFSLPDSTKKAVLFFQKEQMLTKMNEHNQKLLFIQKKYTWRVRKSSMLRAIPP